MQWSEGISRHRTLLCGEPDPIAVDQAAQQCRVPALTIREVLGLPATILLQRGDDRSEPNCLRPSACQRYPLGSACIKVAMPDVLDCHVYHLVQVSARDVVCAEHEGYIRRHPTYPVYLQMLRDGFEPPYSTLFEREPEKMSARDQCRFVTIDRRRCLTAQDLGLTLTGWLSVENRATGLPLKVGDVATAYAHAVQVRHQCLVGNSTSLGPVNPRSGPEEPQEAQQRERMSI